MTTSGVQTIVETPIGRILLIHTYHYFSKKNERYAFVGKTRWNITKSEYDKLMTYPRVEKAFGVGNSPCKNPYRSYPLDLRSAGHITTPDQQYANKVRRNKERVRKTWLYENPSMPFPSDVCIS